MTSTEMFDSVKVSKELNNLKKVVGDGDLEYYLVKGIKEARYFAARDNGNKSSVHEFVESEYVVGWDRLQVRREEFYDKYAQWCKNNDKIAMGKINCFKELRIMPGVKEDMSVRAFVIDGRVYAEKS